MDVFIFNSTFIAQRKLNWPTRRDATKIISDEKKIRKITHSIFVSLLFTCLFCTLNKDIYLWRIKIVSYTICRRQHANIFIQIKYVQTNLTKLLCLSIIENLYYILTDVWWHWRKDDCIGVPSLLDRVVPEMTLLAIRVFFGFVVSIVAGMLWNRWLSDPDSSPAWMGISLI